MNDSTRPHNPFFSEADQALAEQFISQGHIVRPVENRKALDRIRSNLVSIAAKELNIASSIDHDQFLNSIANRVSVGTLNEFRLSAIKGMNSISTLRADYYSLAQNALSSIVGNELAMQRRINLSIQLPNDESSLLPVHADVWAGDSPFEIVLWVPFVDCYGSKTMFLLPPAPDREMKARFAELGSKGAEDLFDAIQGDLLWPTVKYGEVMLFAQTLMHGNRVNKEPDTRWTMNCRFKSVFSPYSDKKLGEFFEPITLRPASRIALDYRLPDIGVS